MASRPKRGEIVALRLQVAREIVRALGPAARYVVAPKFGIGEARYSELSRDLVDRCTLEWLIERVYRMGGSVTVAVSVSAVKRKWRGAGFARFRQSPTPTSKASAERSRTRPRRTVPL